MSTTTEPVAAVVVTPVALAAPTNGLKRMFKSLGPGLITGASDDDPSGIGTYAVAGASLGYTTLWTALVSFPMMTAVQFTCAKIGMVSGTGLAAVLRRRFPRPLVYTAVFALVAANTINAGADIGAIAAAINLLVPIPLTLLIVPIGAAILALQIWGFVQGHHALLQVAHARPAGVRGRVALRPSRLGGGATGYIPTAAVI